MAESGSKGQRDVSDEVADNSEPDGSNQDKRREEDDGTNQGESSEVNSDDKCGSDNRPETAEGDSGDDDDDDDSVSEDVQCSCCMELMVNPTTLECGHNFCRLCIAQWYLEKKQAKCMVCRAEWNGKPRVNYSLRALIKRMHPELAEVRNREYKLQEGINQKTISQFEALMDQKQVMENNASYSIGFRRGMIIVCGLMTLVIVAHDHLFSEDNLLLSKPLNDWTVVDVSKWLSNMGPWTANYVDVVKQKKIDGSMLQQVNETNIGEMLIVKKPLHKGTLLHNLMIVQEYGIKPPSDLWEYHSVYPGWSLFLVYGLKEVPRCTMLVMYIASYHSRFLPFAHTVTADQAEHAEIEDVDGKLPDLTEEQQSWFVLKSLTLPYVLIGNYAMTWMECHCWTTTAVLINCALSTMYELSCVYILLTRQKSLIEIAQDSVTMKCWVTFPIIYILWPLVWWPISEFCFYCCLYFSPFLCLDQLYQIWKPHLMLAYAWFRPAEHEHTE